MTFFNIIFIEETNGTGSKPDHSDINIKRKVTPPPRQRQVSQETHQKTREGSLDHTDHSRKSQISFKKGEVNIQNKRNDQKSPSIQSSIHIQEDNSNRISQVKSKQISIKDIGGTNSQQSEQKNQPPQGNLNQSKGHQNQRQQIPPQNPNQQREQPNQQSNQISQNFNTDSQAKRQQAKVSIEGNQRKNNEIIKPTDSISNARPQMSSRKESVKAEDSKQVNPSLAKPQLIVKPTLTVKPQLNNVNKQDIPNQSVKNQLIHEQVKSSIQNPPKLPTLPLMSTNKQSSVSQTNPLVNKQNLFGISQGVGKILSSALPTKQQPNTQEAVVHKESIKIPSLGLTLSLPKMSSSKVLASSDQAIIPQTHSNIKINKTSIQTQQIGDIQQVRLNMNDSPQQGHPVEQNKNQATSKIKQNTPNNTNISDQDHKNIQQNQEIINPKQSTPLNLERKAISNEKIFQSQNRELVPSSIKQSDQTKSYTILKTSEQTQQNQIGEHLQREKDEQKQIKSNQQKIETQQKIQKGSDELIETKKQQNGDKELKTQLNQISQTNQQKEQIQKISKESSRTQNSNQELIDQQLKIKEKKSSVNETNLPSSSLLNSQKNSIIEQDSQKQKSYPIKTQKEANPTQLTITDQKQKESNLISQEISKDNSKQEIKNPTSSNKKEDHKQSVKSEDKSSLNAQIQNQKVISTSIRPEVNVQSMDIEEGEILSPVAKNSKSNSLKRQSSSKSSQDKASKSTQHKYNHEQSKPRTSKIQEQEKNKNSQEIHALSQKKAVEEQNEKKKVLKSVEKQVEKQVKAQDNLINQVQALEIDTLSLNKIQKEVVCEIEKENNSIEIESKQILPEPKQQNNQVQVDQPLLNQVEINQTSPVESQSQSTYQTIIIQPENIILENNQCIDAVREKNISDENNLNKKRSHEESVNIILEEDEVKEKISKKLRSNQYVQSEKMFEKIQNNLDRLLQSDLTKEQQLILHSHITKQQNRPFSERLNSVISFFQRVELQSARL